MASGVSSPPTEDTSQTHPQAEERMRARRYLTPLLLAPLVLIAASFVVIPSHWFEFRAGNLYLVNLGYGARLHNHECQVLIYGDSGAMVGVDPAIVHERTGLSVCNIAEFQGMTLVNRTLPLDLFLAHNPRPQYLVFLYAPEDLTVPFSWAKYATFEAISFRVKQDPGLRTDATLIAHPTETMAWIEGGLRLALVRVFAHPLPPESAHVRERDSGQLKVPTAHTLTSCSFEVRQVAPDPAWIQHLRTQYGTGGTTVLVDAIPTATCDPNNDFYAGQLRGLIDNYPLAHFPFNAYTDEGLLHTNAYGAGLLSTLVAEQIQARPRSLAPTSSQADARTPRQSSASSTTGDR